MPWTYRVCAAQSAHTTLDFAAVVDSGWKGHPQTGKKFLSVLTSKAEKMASWQVVKETVVLWLPWGILHLGTLPYVSSLGYIYIYNYPFITTFFGHLWPFPIHIVLQGQVLYQVYHILSASCSCWSCDHRANLKYAIWYWPHLLELAQIPQRLCLIPRDVRKKATYRAKQACWTFSCF